jgi:uroporphyrin-III C-methyltransferase
MKSKLYIVGAGPGDSELITLKALKVLQQAEVVMYDALVSVELLEHVPETCLKVYVGKRAGKHSKQQQEIMEMIVHYCKFYQNVVRLKGGDPYVFGRGHEELVFAESHQIETQVIPGISSVTSAPLAAGIPLTKRGVNESFWVVTGTLKEAGLSKDLKNAASSGATVVVLMGMKKLAEIVEVFRELRGGEEPIAIIENGTKANQRCLIGNVGDILEKQSNSALASPAVIIIGKVVNERVNELKVSLASVKSLM